MGSCCLALRAGIYRAERICRLPALEIHAFLWTLFPESNALGSSPANFTHSRWDRSGGSNNNSPIRAIALVWAIPLMPTSSPITRLSSGCFSIQATASAVRESIRFSSWEMASLASRSTAFGVSWVAVSAKQHDPHVKAYFDHLVANGKKPLQGVCAVMRKLLHAIHGMLKHDKPFDNTRFYAIPATVK